MKQPEPESPGVAMNRLRWGNKTEVERLEHSKMMNKARWAKSKPCPCGCGLTLERAKKRHPKRAIGKR
jgi:hypothetical protein